MLCMRDCVSDGVSEKDGGELHQWMVDKGVANRHIDINIHMIRGTWR